MKRIIIFSVVLVSLSMACFAQDPRYRHHSEHYTASYYVPLLWGVNGHRTVEQENRVMEQELAELRYQHMLDTMTPAQIEQLRRRRQNRAESRNEALVSRKQNAKPKESSNDDTKSEAKSEPVVIKNETNAPKQKASSQSTYNPFLIN